MLAPNDIEDLICLLATCDRHWLVSQLLTYRGKFPVDFTPEFISKQLDEDLRHILFALCIQNQRMPATGMVAA